MTATAPYESEVTIRISPQERAALMAELRRLRADEEENRPSAGQVWEAQPGQQARQPAGASNR
jgi:hypothetical protein